MKKITGLRTALLEAGITANSSKVEIEAATKAYWKAYHKAYDKKRKKRSGRRVAVQITKEEYRQLTVLAQERGITKGLGVIFKDAVFSTTFSNYNPASLKGIEDALLQMKNDLNKVVQKIQMKIRFLPEKDDSATFLELKNSYAKLLQRIEVLEQDIKEYLTK